MEVRAAGLSPSTSLAGRSALFSSLFACPSLRRGEDGAREKRRRVFCREQKALDGEGKGKEGA